MADRKVIIVATVRCKVNALVLPEFGGQFFLVGFLDKTRKGIGGSPIGLGLDLFSGQVLRYPLEPNWFNRAPAPPGL